MVRTIAPNARSPERTDRMLTTVPALRFATKKGAMVVAEPPERSPTRSSNPSAPASGWVEIGSPVRKHAGIPGLGGVDLQDVMHMTHRWTFAIALGALAAAACSRDEGGGQGSADSTTGGIDFTESNGSMKLDLPATGGIGTGQAEGGSGCADVQVMVEPETPTIMLLVDQSGSMTSDFSGMQRWDAVYGTLMDPVDGVIKPLESEIRFGLTLYTSENGDDGPMCPMLTEVPPALDNYAAMDAVFGPAKPVDETPTGESLDAVATKLAAFPEPGPKAIVLATDGEPDTCAEPNPQNGQPEALAAAQNAYAMGIKTYILSVGTEVGEDHLQEMANAGVGLDPQDPMKAPFWVALDAQDLADAFDQIVGGFVSCTLELDGIVDLDDFCEGTVLLDGVPLECPVDWELIDEQHIEILGEACDILQDGDAHTLEANFPCGTVSIP